MAETLFGVNRETRLNNRETLEQALQKLWAIAREKSGKTGLLASIPVEILSKQGPVAMTLSLSAHTVTSEREYGEPFDIIARVSLGLDNKTWKDTPRDPRQLREFEVAARQILLAPQTKSNQCWTYVTSAEDWQQHGLAKALVESASDDLARFTAEHFKQILPNQETYLFISDKSTGKGSLTLDKWTTKVMQEQADYTTHAEKFWKKV